MIDFSKMTLRELIERKAIDYGYTSVWDMCRKLGLVTERLCSPMRGATRLGIETRRWIVRELDVSAEVLEKVIRND